MGDMDTDYFKKTKDDFSVLKFLMENDGPVTLPVIEEVFSHFYDVELPLPLPVMDLSDDERKGLSVSIMDEMLETLEKIVEAVNQAEAEEDVEEDDEEGSEEKIYLSDICPELTEELDNLWRELAGCFAAEINSTIQKPFTQPQEEEDFYEKLLPNLADDLDITEDEALSMVQNNSSLRLMLRRNGIDPDRII